MGSRWLRSYTVVGYPRVVRPGWFEPMFSLRFPVTLVLSMAPVDNDQAVKSLNRRLVWSLGAHQAAQASGRLEAADAQTAREDAEKTRTEVARGETRLLEIGLTVTVWGRSPEELEDHCRLLESLCQSLLMVVRSLRFQQIVGLRRLGPLGAPADKVREMDSLAWGTVFPFSSREVLHERGQVMGLNPHSQSLIVVDRFRLASPHSITIGWSGGGKSYAAKLEAVRSRYRGLAVSVIDPEGEYAVLERVGAQIWRIGDVHPPGLPFDPFVVGPGTWEDRERQADFLVRLLTRLSPELMGDYGALVQDAIWSAVQGSRRFASMAPVASAITPQQFEAALAKSNPSAAARFSRAYARWQSVVGPAPPPVSNRFAVYDLSRLTEQMKSAVYLALGEWTLRGLDGEGRQLVIFDEAWHLLTDSDSARYLEELFRRARKRGAAIALVTQDVSDFVRSRSAEVCLRNAPLVWLFRQHAESLHELGQLLHLHVGELERVAQAGIGEGLMIVGEDHVPFRVVASPYEHAWLAQS